MPTVELFVNGKWQPVEVGEGATQKDLDEIGTHLSGGTPPTPPHDIETAPQAGQAFETDQGSTWYGRAGEYVRKRAETYAGALGRITGFGEELGTEGPGAPMPEVSKKQAALDVALLAGTGLAPALTATGLAVGTGARAAGVSEPAAEALETGTMLLGGGVKAASDATAAARAAAAAPAAQRAAQGVSNVAAGVSEAGTSAQAFERAQGLATTPAGEAGAAARTALPAAEATERAAFQEATYDRIAKFADNKGLNATRENAVGQTLRNRLQQAEDEWGQLAGSAEHKQVTKLLDKLKEPAPETTAIIDPATGQPVVRPSGAPAQTVTWKELDDAEKGLQKIRGPSSVRAAIADAKKGLLEGTPAADALETANQRWRLEIRPAKDLATKVKTAESPVKAFQRIAGSKGDPQRLQIAQRLLQAHDPEAWDKVVGGFYSNLFEQAQHDPQRAWKLWQTVKDPIRKIVDPDGVAAKAFEEMTPKESTQRYLVEPPAEMERWQQWAQRGVHAVGIGDAARRFYHGDWLGGLGALGLSTLAAHPTLAAAAVRGGAPTVARTGLAVAGGPLVRDIAQGQ